MVEVGKLQFGENDAKNELFQQTRYGSNVFKSAFQIPPRVDIDDLLRGARFFISGQKGCGKTALLMYVEHKLREAGSRTHTILFKTGIGEPERAKLSSGQNITLFDTSGVMKVQYDYTVNWLWLIYKNLLRLIDPNVVLQGSDIARDLRKLMGVEGEIRASNFGDLAFAKVKGAAKSGLKAGPFTAELNADVEMIGAGGDDRAPMEIIELVERYIPEITTHPAMRCLLFFDELELFWSRADQKERDLFLIRDLLQSVARVNRSLGAHSASFVVYAAVRSEVLEEVNRVGPELVRDIVDFGVTVNWNVKAKSSEQPILKIVEAKIQASEIEADETPTEDIWIRYFPETVYSKDVREHLLDVAMFKPRNIVSRLNFAKLFDSSAQKIKVEAFEETAGEFSRAVWREVEEELLGGYSRKTVSNLKAILTGFAGRFSIEELEQRIANMSAIDVSETEGFRTRNDVINALRTLYRVGAIGNKFDVSGRKGREQRDRWSFRDEGDPNMGADFIVHESLRKVFQLPFADPPKKRRAAK